MIKLLHVVRDEKFIDSASVLFNSFEFVKNSFVIVEKKSIPLKYIKNTKVKILSPLQFSFIVPILHLNYDGVIFHGIEGEFLKSSILKVSKSLKILWIGWGYDYYCYSKKKLIKEGTKNLLKTINKSNRKYNKSFLLKLYTLGFSEEKFLSRIDYFSPVIEDEFKFVKYFSPKIKMKYIEWNYLNLEDNVIKGFENMKVSGNDILLGNSGGSSNNHIDAFNEIDQFKISFKNIVCPISYGDEVYRNKINELGVNRFGDKFIPLNNFLEYKEYVNMVLSCEFVFINSLRQLGMGNLILMLYLGAKVILDSENPAYCFFRKNNIKVYSIQDAKNGCFQEVDLEKTRGELIRIWGREVMFFKTMNLISLFNKD